MSLEQRVKALETSNSQNAPRYEATFEDGTTAILDGLDLIIHADNEASCVSGTKHIKSIKYRSGTMPKGPRWDYLREYIERVL